MKPCGDLFVSDPFSGFIGDCEWCNHYDDISNICTGGQCKLHGFGCGYGHTCKDNTSTYAMNKIKEVENGNWKRKKRAA